MWGLEITLNNTYDLIVQNIDGMQNRNISKKDNSGSSEEINPVKPAQRPRGAGQTQKIRQTEADNFVDNDNWQ